MNTSSCKDTIDYYIIKWRSFQAKMKGNIIMTFK